MSKSCLYIQGFEEGRTGRHFDVVRRKRFVLDDAFFFVGLLDERRACINRSYNVRPVFSNKQLSAVPRLFRAVVL